MVGYLSKMLLKSSNIMLFLLRWVYTSDSYNDETKYSIQFDICFSRFCFQYVNLLRMQKKSNHIFMKKANDCFFILYFSPNYKACFHLESVLYRPIMALIYNNSLTTLPLSFVLYKIVDFHIDKTRGSISKTHLA